MRMSGVGSNPKKVGKLLISTFVILLSDRNDAGYFSSFSQIVYWIVYEVK